jgi:hypothetical protein
VLLWLFVFLAVAAVVTTRQARAYALARELSAATARRDALKAEAAELERRIQHASSRPVLGRRVERLGLRPPSGGEMKVLPLPADAGR